MMRPPPHSRIGKNHRRGVSTTLALVDEALCEFEHWAEGREARSVLYREHNNLSPAQRKSLLAEVSAMRAVIGELRDALGLEAAGQEAAQLIWGRCSALREHLVELTGRHLRRYGKPAPGLADYLDPKVDELLRRLDRVSSLVSGSARVAGTDARST